MGWALRGAKWTAQGAELGCKVPGGPGVGDRRTSTQRTGSRGSSQANKGSAGNGLLAPGVQLRTQKRRRRRSGPLTLPVCARPWPTQPTCRKRSNSGSSRCSCPGSTASWPTALSAPYASQNSDSCTRGRQHQGGIVAWGRSVSWPRPRWCRAQLRAAAQPQQHAGLPVTWLGGSSICLASSVSLIIS